MESPVGMMAQKNDRRGPPPLAFPFHYGQEAESYSFYRVPKILFKAKAFDRLSTDAKLLYGILLDRMQLSIRNGWVDDEGKVYIYFRRQKVMEELACCQKKAGQLMAELDDKNGIGLITRIHQGLGKPDRIYVHKCTLPQMEIRGSPGDGSGGPDSGAGEAGPADFTDVGTYGNTLLSSEVSEIHLQRCKKYPSGGEGNIPPEVSKRSCNKTEINKTEMSETDLIPSGGIGPCGRPVADRAASGRADDRNDGYAAAIEEYSLYREYFEEQCELKALQAANPAYRDVLEEMIGILTDTCTSTKPVIRIGGDDRPVQIVRSRFMKLDSGHIQYVLNCFAENTTKVRNIRQYLLTALYNAPSTIDSYYTAQVQHDLYGDGEY